MAGAINGESGAAAPSPAAKHQFGLAARLALCGLIAFELFCPGLQCSATSASIWAVTTAGSPAPCHDCCAFGGWLQPHQSLFAYDAFPAYFNSVRSGCISVSYARKEWQAIISSLATKSHVKLMVLGGSEAGGVDCKDPAGKSLKNCAWSARLVEQLKSARPDAKIELHNFASGGTHVIAALPLLPTWLRHVPDADVLLVDFIVNDAFEVSTDVSESSRTLVAAYEAFVGMCKRTRPALSIIFINSCALASCDNVNMVIKSVAGRYDIPLVSFYDVAAVAGQLSAVRVHDKYWGADWQAHPSWEVHQLMAESISVCLQLKAKAMCGNSSNVFVLPSSMSSKEQMDAIATCDSPTSEYNAFDPPSTGWQEQSWPIVAERADKPGWISQNAAARISFRVKFGKTPRLILSYLRSYQGLGQAVMYFEAKPQLRLTLNGLYDPSDAAYGQKVSQSFLLAMNVNHQYFQPDRGTSGVLGFNIGSNEEHVVHFEVNAGESTKFKIISVSAC